MESLRTLRLLDCSHFEKFPEIHVNMKRLGVVHLQGTAIKKLPNKLGCLEALSWLDLSGCSNFEELPEIKNWGSLRTLFLNETAIKELPRSIGHLTELDHLNLENCKNLRSLPNSICGLKSLGVLNLNGCSNLVAFPEIMEDMKGLRDLFLSKTPITELPPSIEHLKGLRRLELNNCENLVTLPNSIGNLTHLSSLLLRNCSKLHNLPDNLRSLQCRLEKLDLAGCNLMEGAIPSDLWCLSSLKYLDVSENRIHRIPTGIIQLSELIELRMNHCQMLEEIPELPSRLKILEAHGFPRLGTLSTPLSPLWSSLLNLFKSRIHLFKSRFQRYEYEIYSNSVWFIHAPRGVRDSNSVWCFHAPRDVIPGSGGIPEWISHQRMGCQAIIELPKNRYEDNNFLGFAVFFHQFPLDDECVGRVGLLQFELRISHDDQSERASEIMSCFHCKIGWFGSLSSEGICYDNGSTSDPPLWVTYFPKFAIPSEHRYDKWSNYSCFKSQYEFHRQRGNIVKVKICGIHLIYSKDYHQQNQTHGPEATMMQRRAHIRKDQDISCNLQASPYTRQEIILQETDEWRSLQEFLKSRASKSECSSTNGSESENLLFC